MKNLTTLLFFGLFISSLAAQEKTDALRLYVDCSFCSQDYLRQHLPYIEYVRGRHLADVHLIASQWPTAARGKEVRYELIGQGRFAGLNDSLQFVLPLGFSENEKNEKLTAELETALIPFLARTSYRQYLSFAYQPETKESAPSSDPWKNWVATLSASGRYRKEASYRSSNLRSTVLIRKVTPEIRLQSYNYLGLDENFFQTEDSQVRSFSRELYASNVAIKSINDHWSYGGEVEFRASYFDNLKFQNRYWAALEYNLFPYSESSRRQLRFTSELGYDYRHYNDTTIYNKIREGFVACELQLALELKEQWGEASSYIEVVSFLNEPSRHQLNLWTGLSLNLFQGLTLDLGCDVSFIRNQVGLPRSGLTTEEVLLQQRQQATNFRLASSLGFSYTFGSIYNNVVNPRFGY
ncbi:MAG: hypothetical protein KDD01_00560 [Phaeodactylibacter sp.]|nr:hypothetical protein [Phaeodactylibacter sp.]